MTVQPRTWWRVRWLHDVPDEPVDLFYEVVDGFERRKVEVFRDGRRGFASAFVEGGGSAHSTEAFPSLEQINADPQFRAEVITEEQFEIEWQAARIHLA